MGARLVPVPQPIGQLKKMGVSWISFLLNEGYTSVGVVVTVPFLMFV